jgi:hypothetical protein
MIEKTIKEHIADKLAETATISIQNWNNGESLYENEVNDFVELFRVALLKCNGYE